MNFKLCPYCGTKLKKTNFGREFCPNHGIIENNEEIDEKTDETRSYV